MPRTRMASVPEPACAFPTLTGGFSDFVPENRLYREQIGAKVRPFDAAFGNRAFRRAIGSHRMSHRISQADQPEGDAVSDHYTDGRHWDDEVQGWALDDDPYEDALLSREDLKARIAELKADKKAAREDAAYQEERAEQADAALAAYEVEADAYAQTAAAELVRLYADRTVRDRMLRLAILDGEHPFGMDAGYLADLRLRARDGGEG